jgi:hypothetical protein
MRARKFRLFIGIQSMVPSAFIVWVDRFAVVAPEELESTGEFEMYMEWLSHRILSDVVKKLVQEGPEANKMDVHIQETPYVRQVFLCFASNRDDGGTQP